MWRSANERTKLHTEWRGSISRFSCILAFTTKQVQQLLILGDWPWHSAIYLIEGNEDKKYACGGSLISKDYVLTAGHCVALIGSNNLRKTEEFLLYFGIRVTHTILNQI